ncbi:hypothetical protein HHK36_029017 [Tetracentron sinense]|uniref:Uncharacterized protein n=1 Tax=Tetracentron sinense TaxID=13715 RepID=A0A834YGR3_TETSI|nr:hypothetical protein HHK36_029017 [Tetracentron sinense]
MSRPHDGHRPFFPFGNPFRMILPKGSYLSPKLLALLNSFEENLAERLKKLKPKDRGEVLSLSWLKLAIESLCETHSDIKILITELQFPVSDWDEKWMDVYLDNSVKLLDICIAFSSELSRLNQGQVLLQCILHALDASIAFPSSEQLVQARSSLADWMELISSRNPKLEKCCAILHGIAGSLYLPKAKNSAKGKVLMRAMYGIKVETIFVCSVFMAAFSGSVKPLMDLHVPDEFFWAEAFTDLQADVNGESKMLFSKGNVTILKELEAVEMCSKTLCTMIDEGLGSAEARTLQNFILDFGKRTERLSQGLDLLSKEVEGFFQISLTGRDALLCNLRVCGTDSDLNQGNNGVVRGAL